MGLNSKTSRALADVRLQLRTKKTRGENPRVLTADELHALELKSVRLQEEMAEARHERAKGQPHESRDVEQRLASAAPSALGGDKAAAPDMACPDCSKEVPLFMIQTNDSCNECFEAWLIAHPPPRPSPASALHARATYMTCTTSKILVTAPCMYSPC